MPWPLLLASYSSTHPLFVHAQLRRGGEGGEGEEKKKKKKQFQCLPYIDSGHSGSTDWRGEKPPAAPVGRFHPFGPFPLSTPYLTLPIDAGKGTSSSSSTSSVHRDTSRQLTTHNITPALQPSLKNTRMKNLSVRIRMRQVSNNKQPAPTTLRRPGHARGCRVVFGRVHRSS